MSGFFSRRRRRGAEALIPPVPSELLLETGDALLLETGDAILLEF
jgi:hypothetical protein